ncbi:MAG TPA: hypothetical protein VMF12_16095 [Xanthobacteraceae bacterium]|nr:hypothetical protein [Xanthobacteraceae bacterium]
MKALAFAAMLVLPVASSALAQDFNPGTVIGNVYQNPASGCGYGYGFNCYPPNYSHYATAQTHRLRAHVRKDGVTDRDAQR